MTFYFQEFMVDESLFLIKKNNVTLEMEPRVFELLVYFCQHPNVPISRDELIKHVWQQRVVGDAAINRAVSELRKVLENEPSKPEIIKTISKVGYQFTISPNLQCMPIKEDKAVDQIIHVKKNNTEKYVQNLSEDSTNNSLEINKKTFQLYSKVNITLILITLILATFYLFLPKQKINEIPNAIHSITERPLTSLKGTAYKAVLSNNGKDLLFIHKDKPNGNAQVWIKREDKVPLRITDDDYYYTFAIFASDNEIISSRFNNVQERKCDIVSIDLPSLKTTKILDCADRAITMLAYNLKRKTLYYNFRTAVNSPYSIYAYQRSTERLQQITFPYSDGNIRGDYMLSLSPTGDRLAVFEYQGNSTSLLKIISLSTNEIEYHPHEFEINHTMSWLNDDQIVFSDKHGMLTYDAKSKIIQPLLTNNNIGYVSANPMTGKIVFDKGVLYANIYQYAIQDKNTIQSKEAVTHSSFVNYQPQFSNRTKKRAYISTDEGDTAIMIQPETGQAFKADFTTKINSLTNFHFSPDDSLLVAIINNQLHLYNEKDKLWTNLLSELDNAHHVHYSNEKNIIFSSDTSGDWQIWCLDMSNGELSQLTQKGGYSAQGNIDEGFLYLTKFNTPGLYRLNLTTGEEESLISDFPITSWNKWQVRKNTIYFNRDKGISALDTILKTETVILPDYEGTPSSFSISFDEQYLQHTIIEESSANIWSIETM